MSNVKEVVQGLQDKYHTTLKLLVDALDKIELLEKQLDKKPKEVIIEKEVEVIKEVPVEVEKIIEVEKPIEVEKETVVTREVEVPGPERIVEKEVIKEIEIIKKVEVPVEKIVEKEVEKIVEVERIVEVPVTEFVETKPEVIEKEASKDLHEAARLMAQSEFNKEDLSEKQIYKILMRQSEEEVKKKIGFWAMPLQSDHQQPTNKKYTGKKR